MASLLRKIVSRVLRRSLKKGLGDGNTAWLAIGAVAWLVRLMLKPDKPKVKRTDLHQGETVIVTNVPSRPRGRRRRSSAT